MVTLDERTIRELHPVLLRRAERLVGAGAAHDLLQDVWVAALAALPRFEERASLATWLTGILRHKAFDRHRSQRRRPQDPLPDLVADAPSVVDVVEARQRLRVVRDAFDDLDERSQRAIDTELTAAGDRRALAAELGVSDAGVRVRLFRARAHLARSMEVAHAS